ncbi:hypothetical protein K1719_014304 [Acacia pycnantha]|nr:hypothetical protein K1719_014304 [Acacia pycnantha]
MMEDEKENRGFDQESSHEVEKMSEKPFLSYSDLHEGESKIKINGASDSGSRSGLLLLRVCDFCGKHFNSGKALEGHRRHHILAGLKRIKEEEKSLEKQKHLKLLLKSLCICISMVTTNYHLRHRLPPHDEPTPDKAAPVPVKKRKSNVMNHLNEREEEEEEIRYRDDQLRRRTADDKNWELKQQEVKPSKSYVCNVYNKSFPCFQALGGHKTKRNREKNIAKSTKGKEVVEQRQEEEENKVGINGASLNSSEERFVISSKNHENNSNKEEVGEASQQSGSKIRGFDLNVPYVLEYEATDI